MDGFISSDLTCITVDQFVLERRPNHYRFTLAHELGHMHLHRAVYAELKFASVDEWRRFQIDVDERDYNWLEYQAYAFAGLVLVPTAPLRVEFRMAAEAAERDGFGRKENPQMFFEYVSERLRRVFAVSGDVIGKRLHYEELDR